MRPIPPHLPFRRHWQQQTIPLQPHLTLPDRYRALQTKIALVLNPMLAPAPVLTSSRVLRNRKRRMQIPIARTGVLHFGQGRLMLRGNMVYHSRESSLVSVDYCYHIHPNIC